jgi:hypothetical protein
MAVEETYLCRLRAFGSGWVGLAVCRCVCRAVGKLLQELVVVVGGVVKAPWTSGRDMSTPPPIRRPNLAEFAELVCRIVRCLRHS